MEHDSGTHARLQEAEANSRRRSLFLAGLSHQVRAQLNGVLGMSHLLLDTDLSAHQREIAETVRKACDGLLVILGDLSDFSSIKAGEMATRREQFALHVALKATVANLVFKAHRQGVRLSCEVDDDVPAAAVGDGQRLRQVLANFIDNAIQYTDDGTISVRACLDETAPVGVGGAGGPGDFALRVSVTDTGRGIAADRQALLARLLDGDEGLLDPERACAGLGLAICRDLALMMGGRVGFASEAGKGSTFWFTVTLGRAAVAAPDPAVDNQPPRKPILLVTKDPDAVCQTLVTLHKHGYEVHLAQDRHGFAQILRSNRHGLVLLDGESIDHFATFATWRSVGGVQQVPVLGLPKRAGDGQVDTDRLLQLVGKWAG